MEFWQLQAAGPDSDRFEENGLFCRLDQVKSPIGEYHIRCFRRDDLDALYEILGDPVVMQYIEPPFSREQTAAFLQANGLDAPCGIYALADGADRTVGQVIFHPYGGEAWEIGWILRQDCWGQGLASAVTETLVRYCRETGIRRCVIECDPAQAATRHIAEKSGFSPAGERDGLLCYEQELQGGERDADSRC